MRKFVGHDHPVYSCAVAADERFCVSGGKTGQVCFHDVNRGEAPLCVLNQHDGVTYCCTVNDDSVTVATASADSTIQILDMRAARTARSMITIDDAAAAGSVYKVIWRGEFELLSCGDDYCAKRWDIRNIGDGPLTNYFGHTSPVRALDVSSNKDLMVTGTADGCIRVWVVTKWDILWKSKTVWTTRWKRAKSDARRWSASFMMR